MNIQHKAAVICISILTLGASLAPISQASLIYLTDFDATGEGYGAVDNILSLHNTSVTGGAGNEYDIEMGKVAWDGSGDVITGDWALTDPNKTATFTFDYLGIDDASQILFVWNPSEIQSDSGATQVDFLEMTIYTDAGGTFWQASLDAPVFHSEIINPGLGGGDYYYGLDLQQAGELNLALAGIGDYSQYHIGLESHVSYIDDGPNTWLIGKGPGNPVPEPTSLFLLGAGLAGLSAWRRKR